MYYSKTDKQRLTYKAMMTFLYIKDSVLVSSSCDSSFNKLIEKGII